MPRRAPRGIVMKAVEWAYARSLDGMKGVQSAEELAREHQAKTGTPRERVDRLIRSQSTKAAITGFVSSMGGMAIPVTLPASFALVLFIQVRMAIAIAHIGGWDVRDERVRSLVYACVAGEKPEEALGFTAGAIASVSRTALAALNRRVRARLIRRLAGRRLGRALPIVGGVITARVEGKTTAEIGGIARDTFVPRTARKSLPAKPIRRKARKRR